MSLWMKKKENHEEEHYLERTNTGINCIEDVQL